MSISTGLPIILSTWYETEDSLPEVTFNKTITIPDPIKIERFKKVPELGPRILFFSGGTALKKISQHLIDYTHNSIHIITSFDSGGSSAKLRKAFKMLSVGDLRNRLMALADQSVKGFPDIYKLFAFRLPDNDSDTALLNKLEEIIAGEDPMIRDIRNPMKEIIINHLKYFFKKKPDDFDLRGASIGNLILAGGYLNNHHEIDPVLFIFSKLVQVRGTVRAIDNRYHHLVTELQNDEVLVGQHLLNIQENGPIKSPIKRVYLSESEKTPKEIQIEISESISRLITKADLIVYPIGSFYSSLIANFLPKGVAEAIAAAKAPKVYIPNTFFDPEQFGLDLTASVEILHNYIRNGNGDYGIKDLLDFVIIDSSHHSYPYPIRIDQLKNLGVEIIDTKLVTEQSQPNIDPQSFINTILSIN